MEEHGRPSTILPKKDNVLLEIAEMKYMLVCFGVTENILRVKFQSMLKNRDSLLHSTVTLITFMCKLLHREFRVSLDIQDVLPKSP